MNVATVTAVPEPSALLLAGVGLALLLWSGRLRNRSKATLGGGGLFLALVLGPSLFAQASQNPDFTNVNDILHGNRTLVQNTDLEIISSGFQDVNTNYGYFVSTSLASNSSLGPPNGYLDGNILSASELTFLNFSGRMFNQAPAVTVVVVREGGAYSVRNCQKLDLDEPGSLDLPPKASKVTNGAMGDFNGDGYDDLAVSFDDGSIQVGTASDVNSPNRFQPLNFGPVAALDALAGISAGDFNGDGRAEIAGLSILPNGGLKLVIYTIDPNSLAISPAASLTLNTAAAGSPINVVSIARGRFNTTTHDQLAVAFATNSGNAIVEVLDFSPGSLTPTEGPQLTASTVSIPVGYLQVKTGQFGFTGGSNSTSYDQIVFHSSSTANGGRFFEVLSVNPVSLALTVHGGVTYDQFPCAAGIQVGNFDHQQADPNNPNQTQHNPNSQIAFLYCASNPSQAVLNIYSVNSQTFDIVNPPNSAITLPSGVTALNSTFVATDIQGRSLVLGEPKKVTITATKPDIIVGMPPMHIDYITPVGGNKPEVLNISFIPDGFNSAFSLVQDSQTGSTTSGKLSWSAGVDVSVTGHYQIGDPDNATGFRAKLGADFASNFTGSSGNSTVNYTGSSYKIGATAKTGDQVYFDSSRQNIWVYPVIGQKGCPSTTPNCTADQQVPMTFQFSGPDQIETGQTSTEDFGSFWYQPAWEFANVLSYPANLAQLTLIYPAIASDPTKTILSSQTSFKPTYNNTQIQANWSGGQTQGSSSSLANLTSFDINTSYTDNFGVGPIAQGGVDTSLKLSGSVGFDHLQENTAQIDASNGIGITSNAHFLNTGNYGYWVTPYILGNPPSVAVADSQTPPQADIQTIGPLTTVFTADPTNTTEGGAWWSQSFAYGSLPDVALNHPARWTPSNPGLGETLPSNCGNYGTGASDLDCFDIAPLYDDNGQPLDPWLSNFLSMRGFFIARVDDPGTGPQLGFATAGDKLDLAVRVYNYSLAAMPDGTTVHVRFYAMPMDGNGNSLGDSTLIGESVAGLIPQFCGDGSNNGCNTSDVNWRVIHAPAPFDTTPYGGKFFAFWVVVWMQDANGGLVREIQGHGLTSVPGTLTKPSDVPLEMATATDGKTTVSYSNNVGFYHYAFPVLAKPNGLGAPPPANPEDITLKAVTAAKSRVQIGELDVITAVLRAGSEGAKKLKVHFYDGDPEAGGNLINTQIAWFEPRTITKVRIPYHPPKNGVYRIWAVINKGQSYQTVRHTAAILVGNAVADRNNSDGDKRSNERASNSVEKD